MAKLNNTISELLKQHISIYDKMEWDDTCSAHFARQLDFLEFWVSPDSMKNYSPWIDLNGEITPPRDNPNMELTEYENVYKMVKLNSIDYVYVSEGRAPVSILQWYQCKNQHRQWWKISVYGKGLRLYFNWLLPWLPDYVKKYESDTIRADLCRDTIGKIPAGVIDLNCQKTVPDDTNWTWKYFWTGDLQARIYDKSKDLRDNKGIHYWLYPERYKENCWRVEFVFLGRYAKSLSPSQWLLECPTDWTIKPFDNKKYNDGVKLFRSLAYSTTMLVDESVLTSKDKLQVYVRWKELIEWKINKLLKNKLNCL